MSFLPVGGEVCLMSVRPLEGAAMAVAGVLLGRFAKTAMGRYITAMENAFIQQAIAQFNRRPASP